VALCALLRQYSANPRQRPPSRRIRLIQPATDGEKSPLSAIAESAHEPRWHCRIHAATPSIGSPFATHKQWRKKSDEQASEDDPRPACGDIGGLRVESQPESAAQLWPKTHPKLSRISPEHYIIYLRISSKLGITKRIGWHTFRHTYATLLKSSGADVKVVQDSLRHANARITMEMYTQALTQDKRTAQTKVVQMMLPKAAPPLARAG
jgi:hypothetical protein